MKKYLLRGIILLLLITLYIPVNRFFDMREAEFSRPHTFTFSTPLPQKFYEYNKLDKDTFQIAYVVIAGGFSGWSADDPTFLMEKVSNHIWQKTLTLDKAKNPYKYVVFPVKPGKKSFSDYHYTEGFWVEDVNASHFEDDSFGGLNSVYIVRTTKMWKKLFSFFTFALIVVLLALTLLEFAVRILMHASLSLKSKLILIFSLLLISSNVFFIYYSYRQTRSLLIRTQIDKFNMIHNFLLGEGVDFFTLNRQETKKAITETLNKFFLHSSLREDFDLFSNTKQPIGRISILDPEGKLLLYSLEPSQEGFLRYWLNTDQSRIDSYMKLMSYYIFKAYKNKAEVARNIFSLHSFYIFYPDKYPEIPDALKGKLKFWNTLFLPEDQYLYPIYYKYQLVGYYVAQIYPESYSRILQNIITFNLILILILSGMFFLLISQLGKIILEPLHHVIQGINRIQEGDYEYEIHVDTRDEIKTLSDSYNFLREYLTYTRRKVEHYNQHLEDIVEERTHELQVLNTKLQDMDELKSRFFANISHDLRTPLTLILAPIEYILDEDIEDPQQIRHNLVTIRKNSLRLLKLINNLLDFSKLDAGKLNPRFRPTNIRKILEFLVSTLDSAAHSRDLKLTLDFSGADTMLYIDPEMFEKIIMNLLSNAFKFTPPQGSISLLVQDQDDAIQISIQDTGVGIPQDKLGHIFERFAQVDSSEKREFEGTGIGLSLVKELMDLHHGEISVQSAPGKGSVFSLRFLKGSDHLEDKFLSAEPVREIPAIREYLLSDFQKDVGEPLSPQEKAPVLPSPVLNSDFIPQVTGSRILVVEDQADMRQFIQSLLSGSYEVSAAKDGKEAWDMIQITAPDLIISDVMMPRMTGYELCEMVKNHKDYRHIPLVLLTAKVDESGKLTGLEHHADDYLSKPFNTRELLARIQNLLISRKLENQLLARQKEIDQDLAQAALVQHSILSGKKDYERIKGLEIDVRFLPMSGTVSGDYYNISPLRSGRASLTIADCAGHGLQAALSTMQLDVLSRESRVLLNQPGERMTYINGLFVKELQTRTFLTVFNVDIFEDRISYCSAGHPDQLLLKVSEHRIVPLNAQGQAIGYIENSEFVQGHQMISAGDILLLFTDGIIEEFSPQGEEYGQDRLLQRLQEWLDDASLVDLSMKDLNRRILENLEVYLQKQNINDDITLIAVRIK